MITNVLKNYGSLSLIRILSRVLEFFLKAYLIRSVLQQSVLGHLVNLDFILTFSLSIVKVALKPSYQKVSSKENSITSGMNLLTLGVLVTAALSFLTTVLQIQYINAQ